MKHMTTLHSKLIPLHKTELYAPNGLPWETVDQARWAFRHREENGLAPAFKRIGKSILIDVPAFHEAISKLTA